MKDNQVLEYHEKQQFNSENLQQYDNEGQRYFLAYLLRKGYNLEIKESKIIFKDITSEEKVKEMIEHYNNDSRIDNLNVKRQSIREARAIGLEEYSQIVDKKLRSLNQKEREKQKDNFYKQVDLGWFVFYIVIIIDGWFLWKEGKKCQSVK